MLIFAIAIEKSDLRDKQVVLFFWPLDFTFGCPTEIIAHHKRVEQFRERNVEVVGVSIDSRFAEPYGAVCPAARNKDETGMKPTAEGVAAFLSKHGEEL